MGVVFALNVIGVLTQGKLSETVIVVNGLTISTVFLTSTVSLHLELYTTKFTLKITAWPRCWPTSACSNKPSLT